jgi:hypothetical protein
MNVLPPTRGWRRLPDHLCRQEHVNGKIYICRVYPQGPPYRWTVDLWNGSKSTHHASGTVLKLRRAKIFAVRSTYEPKPL